MSEINEKKIENMFNKAFFQYIEWLCMFQGPANVY